MNAWEYLAQCGFWQWVGNVMLAACLAAGLGQGLSRLRGDR